MMKGALCMSVLSMPQNYTRRLYLSGIQINFLQFDRFLRVRAQIITVGPT